MSDREWLTSRFEEQRPHLWAVAYRMVGSRTDADDAVQEAWLRLDRADTSAVENLGGWLTTVVARVCLDMLRSRSTKREEPLENHEVHLGDDREAADPEQEAVLADSVGLAMFVVLETLSPAERVSFVLHDLFAVPFNEIGPIIGRSPAASRQLASRARRRVRTGSYEQQEESDRPESGRDRRQDAAEAKGRLEADYPAKREIVDAFFAAARHGDFATLLSVLDPDVVLRVDRTAVAFSKSTAVGAGWDLQEQTHGAEEVGRLFNGNAAGTRPAIIDGTAGAVWAVGDVARTVFTVEVVDGKITGIDAIADPEHLDRLELTLLDR